MTRQQEGFTQDGIRQPDSEHGAGENIADLIRQLTGQGTHLAEQQLNLVKAEVRESVNDVKVAVGEMAGAAVVGIAGLGVTLMGLGYLLGDAIDSVPLGVLIVGVATLILAYVLYSAGSKKVSSANLTPDRTVRTIERTPDAARGNLTSETRP
jgi:hypothetical protein